MKASVFRVTGSVASLASCLVLCGGVVSAQSMSDSSISDSGRDSNNVIKYDNSCTSTVKNTNWIDLTNNNQQTAVSGDANVNNNDDVSNVSTGTASNSSSSSFSVNIDNSGNGGCMPTTQSGGGGGETGGQTGGGSQTGGMGGETMTTTTVTPAAPASGGMGGETVATPTAAPEVAQVSTVPVGGVGAGTGGQTYLEGLVAVTLLSGALGAARLYKPFKSLSGRFA